MTGYTDKNGKFHPFTKYQKVGRRFKKDDNSFTFGKAQRDDNGIKMTEFKIQQSGGRLTVEDNTQAKVPTELVTDLETEQLYKVIDVMAEPMTTRKIPSNIFIHIIDMEEATGDSQPEGSKYVGEVILMPRWRYIHPKIKEGVADSAGWTVKEFEEHTGADKGEDRWVLDMMMHSGGIRLGQDEVGGDPVELKQRLANKTPAYGGMIGFFLDNAWNQIGTTGWDSLEHLTKNRDPFGGKP